MNTRLIFISITLLLFSSVSCSKEPDRRPLPFGSVEEFTLIHSKTVVDNHLNFPLGLDIYKNKLFVTDRSNQPSVFVFLIDDSGNVDLIKEMGREGRGSGEFIYPKDIIPTETGVYVYDAQSRKLAIINDQLEFETRELFFRGSSLPIDIHIVSDSLFLTTGVQMDSRVQLMKAEEYDIHEIDRFGELISLGDRFESMPRRVAAAWNTRSVYSPALDRLALFSLQADYIELYHISEGEMIHSFYNPDNKTPKAAINGAGEFMFMENATMSYIDVTSDQRYIYALYSGDNYHSEISSYGKFLHIFDWDLNFQKAYELDHHSLSIKADGNNGIYSLSHHPEVAIRYTVLAGQ